MKKKIFRLLCTLFLAFFGYDVLAVTILNPNAPDVITGYPAATVNNYIGINTGVIQSTSGGNSFYCLEPGIAHPLQTAVSMWDGQANCNATSTVYTNSDNNYAACAMEATTGFGTNAYANVQLHLWQALEKNVSLSSYCDSAYDYYLTTYTCNPINNTFLTGSVQKLGLFTKALKDPKGTLRIQKVCEEGVTGSYSFRIFNAYEEQTTTVACGSFKNISLSPGTYTVTESVTGNISVSPSSSISNVIIEENETNSITFTNSKSSNSEPTGSIKITKTNGSSNAKMSGVVFKLVKVVGNSEIDATYAGSGSVVGNLTTNTNGEINISDLAYGTYRIKEVSSSLSGFAIMPPRTVIISDDTPNLDIQITNNPLRVKVVKTNIDGTTTLSGATFLIKDKVTDSTISQPVITTTNNYFNFEVGEYIITEVIAPDGYENLDISFTLKVDSDGKVTLVNSANSYVTLDLDNTEYVLNIKNDVEKITISKKDSNTNKEVAGAKLKITALTGDVVLEWETSLTPNRISLDEGTYILTEAVAPKGYTKVTKKLEFTVKEDGTIEIPSDTDANFFSVDELKITIYNTKPTKIPDTSVGIKIALITTGIALISFGGYIVIKRIRNEKKETI